MAEQVSNGPRELDEEEFVTIRSSVIDSMPPGLDEVNFEQYFKPAMEFAIGQAENSPAPVKGSAGKRFVSEVLKAYNPLTMAEGVVSIVTDPMGAVNASRFESERLREKAIEARQSGSPIRGAAYDVASRIPLIGPAAVEAGEQIAAGDIAGGLGKAAAILGPSLVGRAAAGVSKFRSRLPGPLQAQVQAIAEGKVAIPANLNSGQRAALVKRIREYDPSFSLPGSAAAQAAATVLVPVGALRKWVSELRSMTPLNAADEAAIEWMQKTIEAGDEASAVQAQQMLSMLERLSKERPTRASVAATAELRKSLDAAPRIPLDPKTAEAASEFLVKHDIPSTIGSATGSAGMTMMEELAGHASILGWLTQLYKRSQQGKALSRVGHKLAESVAPTSSARSIGAAGADVSAMVTAVINRFAAKARAAYKAFDDAVEDPKNARVVKQQSVGTLRDGSQAVVALDEAVQLPVDMGKVRPLLEKLINNSKYKKMGPRDRATYELIKNLLNEPRYISARSAEDALGLVKSYARDRGGLAKLVVKKLQEAIGESLDEAGLAGQDILAALERGRDLTAQMYRVKEVLSRAQGAGKEVSGVKTMRRLTKPGDERVSRLVELRNVAPDALPIIGRGVLEELLGIAEKRGGFSRGGTVLSQWEKLGSETRRLLFGPAEKELDQFFQFVGNRETLGNTSRTALALVSSGTVKYIFHDPLTAAWTEISGAALAQALWSPMIRQHLLRAIRTPQTAKVASIKAGAGLVNAMRRANIAMEPFRESGVSGALALPKAAEDRPMSDPTWQRDMAAIPGAKPVSGGPQDVSSMPLENKPQP